MYSLHLSIITIYHSLGYLLQHLYCNIVILHIIPPYTILPTVPHGRQCEFTALTPHLHPLTHLPTCLPTSVPNPLKHPNLSHIRYHTTHVPHIHTSSLYSTPYTIKSLRITHHTIEETSYRTPKTTPKRDSNRVPSKRDSN